MSLGPHFAALVVSCSAAGLLMALAGIGKNGLEWRSRRRICPSCGRQLRYGACACR
jgi:NADH pyrophosphatase NudC (nudix superfamily)